MSALAQALVNVTSGTNPQASAMAYAYAARLIAGKY